MIQREIREWRSYSRETSCICIFKNLFFFFKGFSDGFSRSCVAAEYDSKLIKRVFVIWKKYTSEL